MALMNSFGAFLTLGWCLYQQVVPRKMESFIIWGGIFTAGGKILAQWLYYMAISRAPLSHIIPYLAWNPVFLLIVGFLMLGENPTTFGCIGCLIVLFGAYLISIDAKSRQKEEQDRQNLVDYQNGVLQQPKREFFIVSFAKAIWGFKAGLFMMGVAFCWTYTSALEKYILYGSGIPAPFFLGVQRVLMAIPCMFYSIFKRPKFIDHTFSSFIPLVAGSFFESCTVITYFMALDYVFVSYVIAIKRAGNIFISVMIGRYYYKETLTPMTVASAVCMMIGVLCIVLG